MEKLKFGRATATLQKNESAPDFKTSKFKEICKDSKEALFIASKLPVKTNKLINNLEGM